MPATFLFAFAGTSIVGRVSIRHALNPYLERFGGHIGYVVVPRYRRQGYATAILRQALQIARQKLGLKRVLVTWDDDNLGSIKTIEKNGGVLEGIVSGPDGSKLKAVATGLPRPTSFVAISIALYRPTRIPVSSFESVPPCDVVTSIA